MSGTVLAAQIFGCGERHKVLLPGNISGVATGIPIRANAAPSRISALLSVRTEVSGIVCSMPDIFQALHIHSYSWTLARL